MSAFKVAVFSGGISPERDISIVSGKCVAEALSKNFDVDLFVLEKNSIPKGLSPKTHIVFPAMHGDYGEDGSLQAELERDGFDFAGCGSLSSRVCMTKPAAKSLMRKFGVPVPNGLEFPSDNPPPPEALAKLFPNGAVLKPSDKGSSVGLVLVNSPDEFFGNFRGKTTGEYLAEEMCKGREFSVGVLYGKACGVVEIIPEGGVYDYDRKYTKGSTNYEFPAKISEECSAKMKKAAELAFSACSCRDFARVDFILINETSTNFVALEINTLPGMTPTSLMPKSASCVGLNFEELCSKMLEGAISRHSSK